MPVARSIQTSMASGEFDPLLWSREDVSFFYNSLRRAENVVPLPQGGVRKREGFRFRGLQRGTLTEINLGSATITAPAGGTAADLTDNDLNDALTTSSGSVETITGITAANPPVVTISGTHPWSTGDSVTIEGVNGFHSRTGTTVAITGATQANPVVVTSAGHGFSSGDLVEITSVGGMTELNGGIYTITRLTVDTFQLNDTDGTGFSAYTSGGTAEILEETPINGEGYTITRLTSSTFSLQGLDASDFTAYSSSGSATRGLGSATLTEIIRIDFGSATDVSVLDLLQVRFSNLPSAVDGVLMTAQESANGTTWTNCASFRVGGTAYDRRFAKAPNAHLSTSRYLRVIVDNPDGDNLAGATVLVGEIEAWLEASYTDGGTVGNFSMERLTSTITDEFIIILTDRNADIFRGDTGAWVAAARIPHTNTQVQATKGSPYLDTLILYHQDQHPFQVQRLGSDGDWRSGRLEFESVVEFPFDDDNVSGGENEIQYWEAIAVEAGDKVVIEFGGDVSDQVEMTDSASTNAFRIRNAIESLQVINDVSVTIDEGNNRNAELLIEFIGEDGNKPWPILVVRILSGDGATIEIKRKQRGREPFDLLWSETRGYPSCGTFYQGRHWMGGFKARPDVLVASRAGDLFDFREDKDPVASSPLVIAPNLDDQVTIQNLYPGRHLQIFTSSAELYIPDEPITIDNIALKVTGRYGATSDVSPVDVQGGTLFVDRNGRALREYLFTDAEQSYTAEPVSLLAGHLVSSPRALALRRAKEVDEPTMLLMANTGLDRNGDSVPAAFCTIDRAQQVTAFARQTTDGAILSCETTQAGDAFVMVQRSLAGETWNYIEQLQDGAMLDCSVSIETSGSTLDVSDWPHLEGQGVQVIADGLPLGEFTVSSGSIDLGGDAVTADAEIGLLFLPTVQLHPFKGRGEQSPTMQAQRIFRLLLQLERTGNVAISAHDGGTPRPVALSEYDTGIFDGTLEDLLFTGSKRIGGIGKWQREPYVTITQTLPMPFLVRAATYDVRF